MQRHARFIPADIETTVLAIPVQRREQHQGLFDVGVDIIPGLELQLGFEGITVMHPRDKRRHDAGPPLQIVAAKN